MCLNGLVTTNIVIMQEPKTVWPENMKTLSRQHCYVPSSVYSIELCTKSLQKYICNLPWMVCCLLWASRSPHPPWPKKNVKNNGERDSVTRFLPLLPLKKNWSDSTPLCQWHRRVFCVCEYLRESETICEPSLTFEYCTGAKMGQNREKEGGQYREMHCTFKFTTENNLNFWVLRIALCYKKGLRCEMCCILVRKKDDSWWFESRHKNTGQCANAYPVRLHGGPR